MVTRIDLQNVSLKTFRDAAGTGGRIRVKDGGDGRPELVYGERRTLFGRAVGWIRDAFKSTARLEREVDQEVAAARVFFDLVKEKYGTAAATGARASVLDDLASGGRLTKLAERSIEVAKATRRGERDRNIARNMTKAEAVRPGTQGFARASAAAEVDAGSLSIGQLKFADAVIRFEALAARDTPLKESDIVATAQAAARAAGALTDDLTDTLWFSGKATLGEEIDRLTKEDPAAVGALLGSTPHMDAALLKAPAFNALMKDAVREARLQWYLPDAAFPLPDGDAKLDRDFFSAWTAEATYDMSGDEATRAFRSRLRQKNPVSVTVPWADGTADYRVSGQFLGDVRRTDMLIPVEADVIAAAAADFDAEELVRDLAAKAPAVERTIYALSDEDATRLDDFAEAVNGLADGDETTVVLQPAQPRKVGEHVREPDSELTLMARRSDDGVIQISAAMEANLANLGSADEAVRQVVLLAGGDQAKVLHYTGLLNQTALNLLVDGGHKGLKIGPNEILLMQGGAGSRDSLRASVDRNGDFIMEVSTNKNPQWLAASRVSRGAPPAADTLVLDRAHSIETSRATIRLVPADEAASDDEGGDGDFDNLTVEVVGPMRQEVSLRPDFKTLARAELGFRREAVEAGGDPGDAETLDRGGNNDLLFSLYAPGGLREAEIWDAADADPDDFSEAAKDLVGLLLANEVHVASGPLTPDAFVRMAGRLIEKVADLADSQVVESLRADANLARVLERTLEDLREVRNPADLVGSLRMANAAQTRLLAARGVSFDKDSVVQTSAPVNASVIAGWPTQEVRRLVDRMLSSPDVRAFMAVHRDTVEHSASVDLPDGQKRELFEWGDVLEGVLRAALTRLGRETELGRLWDEAADGAPPERNSAMRRALADALAEAVPQAGEIGRDESDSEMEEPGIGIGRGQRPARPVRPHGAGVFDTDDEGEDEDKSVTASRRFMTSVAARNDDEGWVPEYAGDKGKDPVSSGV